MSWCRAGLQWMFNFPSLTPTSLPSTFGEPSSGSWSRPTCTTRKFSSLCRPGAGAVFHRSDLWLRMEPLHWRGSGLGQFSLLLSLWCLLLGGRRWLPGSFPFVAVFGNALLDCKLAPGYSSQLLDDWSYLLVVEKDAGNPSAYLPLKQYRVLRNSLRYMIMDFRCNIF